MFNAFLYSITSDTYFSPELLMRFKILEENTSEALPFQCPQPKALWTIPAVKKAEGEMCCLEKGEIT